MTSATTVQAMAWGAGLLLLLAPGCRKLAERVRGESGSQSSKPSAPAPSCRSDLDCDVCDTRKDCGCSLKGSPECGPMEHPCFAPPCLNSSASCWNGQCVFRRAAAAGCSKDDECEVRDDACQCDVFAALKSAAQSNECAGRGCGGRPAKNQYRARCYAGAKRCVLERAPGK